MDLERRTPDFSRRNFAQRFTGGLSDDGGTMAGAWDTDPDGGGHWQLDFRLTHRRTG